MYIYHICICTYEHAHMKVNTEMPRAHSALLEVERRKPSPHWKGGKVGARTQTLQGYLAHKNPPPVGP